MTIDLGKEFKRMAEEFDIEDKDVLLSVRTMIRSMWGDSVFKQEFLNRASVMVKNTNTRSMKRFPLVRRYQCAICGEMFGATAIELDHIKDENTLTSYDHINDFIKSIVLTSPDNLQILCKDKKTKKDGITHFGCHGIKTYASRYGLTFEQAKVKKDFINICKKHDKVIDKLKELGVTSQPKTIKGRKELLEKLMLGDVK